jgi:hypothetical protein
MKRGFKERERGDMRTCGWKRSSKVAAHRCCAEIDRRMWAMCAWGVARKRVWTSVGYTGSVGCGLWVVGGGRVEGRRRAREYANTHYTSNTMPREGKRSI